MKWLKTEQNVEPYSKLALIYDDIMVHVDYKLWANYIHSIINKWHENAINVIDISCGTGAFLIEFSTFNYQLAGCDYSYDMVAKAQTRLQANNLLIPIWQDSIINISYKKKMDTVVCLYDSVNYLLKLDELVKLLNKIYSILNKNGLFIFDICTEKNSIKYFSNFVDRDRGKNYSYTRESNYNKKSRIHSNKFEIKFFNSNTTYIEKHTQKIYYINEVINLIKNSNFKLLDVLDGFSYNNASENSLRVHFVLKKV